MIEKGRALQQSFTEKIFENTDEQAKAAFLEMLKKIEDNLNTFLEGDC